MFSIFKRKPAGPPPVPWIYLGWTEIKYVNKEGGTDNSTTIHFYGRGDDLKERKYEYSGLKSMWEPHVYIQQAVLPWIEGNNLWTPIKHPSDNFKEWTEEKRGFVWKGERWHKPAQRLEGNVIKFPRESEG